MAFESFEDARRFAMFPEILESGILGRLLTFSFDFFLGALKSVMLELPVHKDVWSLRCIGSIKLGPYCNFSRLLEMVSIIKCQNWFTNTSKVRLTIFPKNLIICRGLTQLNSCAV